MFLYSDLINIDPVNKLYFLRFYDFDNCRICCISFIIVCVISVIVDSIFVVDSFVIKIFQLYGVI